MQRIFVLSFLIISFCAAAQNDIIFSEREALLNVTVTDFSNKPMKGHIIVFEGDASGLSFKGVSDADGKFHLVVPKGDTYIVKYREFASDEEYAQIEISDMEGRTTSEILIRIELPKTYVLDNVFFDTGKASLRPESHSALNNLSEVMALKETLVIEIAGHTDNVGGEELNMKLSQERAESVRSYLIRKGIQSDRIIAKGYGFSIPVADNDTEEGRAKNRRTEVRVLKE